MSLNVLDNKFRINLANNDFYNILSTYSAKSISGNVQYEIFKDNDYADFNFLQNIFYLKDLGIWFSYIKKYNRHIYVFGADKPQNFNNKPFCIIDFSDSGINQDTTAVFAQDKKGRVSILYRVNQNNLDWNSFELDIEGGWIQAKENGINNYFIFIGELNSINFIETFKKFIIDYEKNISSKNGLKDNALKENFCESCGNAISFIKSDNEIINELHLKNKNLCKPCIEKLAAEYVTKKIKEKIKVTIFNKDSLLERVDEPDLYQSYLKLLVELGYLKEINKNLFIFDKKTNSEDQESSFNIEKTGKKEKIKEEKCVKCGVVLSSNNSIKSGSKIISDKCKDCTRKTYAVKALNHLEEYVDPGISFNKDDLLKQVDNKTRFLDYLWTLEEFDLLEKDNKNGYVLKSADVLLKFKEKYGKVIKESEDKTIVETISKEKTSKKIIKECETCHQNLPISKFYKSGDGYTDKCKECSRKSYAAKAIIEIKNYVVPEVEFYKDDLLKQFENTTQILDYFWTLQDFDFIEHNEKNNTYILKPEKELNSFIQKYGDENMVDVFIDEIPAENTPKTVKECLTCKKVLPVSSFYKSSESNDGLIANCKKCSDKLNAASILSEITNHIGIGFPFSKKDLFSRLGNPNRANYYIWVLLEHDLIEHNDSTDTFIIEDNEKYQEYIKLAPKLKDTSEETPTTPIEENAIESEENSIIKDIIYISEISDLNNYRTVVLRGIVQNHELYQILEEIKNIITSNMTNMNCDRYKEKLIKLIVELDIENEKFEETLDYLHSHQWKKF